MVIAGSAIALVATAAFSASAQVGYQFDITTTYQYGGTDINGIGGGPNTGYLTVTNDGASTFTGTISLDNDGGSFLHNAYTGVFTPGTSWTLASGPEGSNQGGFGPLGLLFTMNGTVMNGANSEAVSLGIHDGDIHSGAPRLSADGLMSDSYVLQGGDPNGYDNGDGFETTQAPGHASFSEQAVPEPAPMAVAALGLGTLVLLKRRNS